MLRARLALLSLLATTLAIPAGAQNTTDTAVADTVPKKKSRFGGLMSKAKEVAGNKAIQGAVKGAATGVACTVVPGAAVVGAATGSGPCASTLSGIMSAGGLKGAATSAASTAAAGAASKAATKMTGAKGAATVGALTGAGGAAGIGQAAAAAAAARMAPKGGASMAGALNAATAGKKGSNAKLTVPVGAPPGMAEAMAAMGGLGAALGTANANASKVETVDFRELKALLPESLRGMKRTTATGEKHGAMGIQISTAEGRYASDDGNSVTVTIADIGSVTGLAGLATYAWASTEIDRDSDGGYEKTTMFKGFKAFEKYDRQSRSGELSVLVGGRFVVGAEGNGIDMDALKSALGNVDLRKLDRMKGQGVK